jgi:hypothetical protein
MFKKRNALSKLWLKHTDRVAYKTYKWELINYKQDQYVNFLIGENRLNNLDKIKAAAAVNNTLNFTHSGNAGDIIYALPTIKKIQEITGATINLYLVLGKPMNLRFYSSHPMGNVMMNEKMAGMLFPLLRSLSYINTCDVYANQKIDIDLDYFRAGLIPQDRGNIARWCGYITGVSPDLWKEWITADADSTYSDSIVIARSGRYQNTSLDFSFINKYNNLKFIGVESEYNDLKQQLPKLEWVQVPNFLHMARMIAGCKFFIGNQSFPYSIAEALKVPRILEVAFEVINVVPEGPNGHDFFFQEHFEWLVADLDSKK